MSVTTLLLIVLILILVGGIPNWHGYGYGPSGLVGAVLVVLLVLLLMGRL